MAEACAFELEGVGVTVGGRAILRPLSFGIKARRVTGLIGHNGSGKSTLLKLLARQQAPGQGRILLEGRAIADWGSRAFARKVAYLPQYPPAASGMLVRELVGLGRYPWHGPFGRFGAADRAKVAAAMAMTRVAPFADRLVDSLSGGERQRAWIAMLVAQDAEHLLLDEPTSALDLAHQMEVLSLLRRLAEERAISVVVVLHDVNMCARFCDGIFALQGGALAAQGTPDRIMTPEQLQALYGVAMDVVRHPSTGGPVGLVR